MLTGKQKVYLRGLANRIDQRYLLGKNEPEKGFYEVCDKALEAKELIKIGLLQTSEVDIDALCEDLRKNLRCEIVQRVGKVIVLYRRNEKNPKIVLPKAPK